MDHSEEPGASPTESELSAGAAGGVKQELDGDGYSIKGYGGTSHEPFVKEEPIDYDSPVKEEPADW